MRANRAYALAMTTLIVSRVLGQTDQTRPPDMPSDQNVAAFTNRAEGAMLSGFQHVDPIVEAYFQRFVPVQKLGYVLDSDRYVLGRFKWRSEPMLEDLLNYEVTTKIGATEKSADDQELLDGLLQIMVPDWKQLGPERYEYKFVRRTFLGAVRCAVYDVKPLNNEHGFTGRIYIEDKSWNIVRFTGMHEHFDKLFGTLRSKNSRFRIDSWRVNTINPTFAAKAHFRPNPGPPHR